MTLWRAHRSDKIALLEVVLQYGVFDGTEHQPDIFSVYFQHANEKLRLRNMQTHAQFKLKKDSFKNADMPRNVQFINKYKKQQ